MKTTGIFRLLFIVIVGLTFFGLQKNTEQIELAENIHVKKIREELSEYPLVNLVDHYRNFDDLVQILGLDYTVEENVLKISGEPNGNTYVLPSSDAVPASYILEGPVYLIDLRTEYGEALDALYHDETLYLRVENFERVNLLRSVDYDFDNKERIWYPKK